MVRWYGILYTINFFFVLFWRTDRWAVAEERLGRGAASAVDSGVVPLGGGNAFGEGAQKAHRVLLLLGALFLDNSVVRRWTVVPLRMELRTTGSLRSGSSKDGRRGWC